MTYLDLSELDSVHRSVTLLSQRRYGWASFLRGDHLGPPDVSLTTSVRELILERTGLETRGPVRLLTQLRNWGIYFSPLNLYYCFDEAGEEVEAIVAEVSNNPWLERHYYVLWAGNHVSHTDRLKFIHRKDFHVSPFMSMDAEYQWQLTPPGSDLDICLKSISGGRPLFQATMAMSRRPLNNRELSRLLLRFPVTSARITAAIYYQALKLWMKKCPFYPHPKRAVLESRQST